MPLHEQSPGVILLRDAVDAVLVPRGFAAGQVGTADGRGQLIWCAAADEFAARFPALPASREPADGRGTMCTDLVVDLVLTDGVWSVSGVRLEGEDVDHVLTGLGSADAQRLTALVGSPTSACLAPLPSLLGGLFDGLTGDR